MPMLFLAPLNLVPLMIPAGLLLDDVVQHRKLGRPLGRFPLAFGNSGYAVAPVLVLAAAGHEDFAWQYWPVDAVAGHADRL